MHEHNIIINISIINYFILFYFYSKLYYTRICGKLKSQSTKNKKN